MENGKDEKRSEIMENALLERISNKSAPLQKAFWKLTQFAALNSTICFCSFEKSKRTYV